MILGLNLISTELVYADYNAGKAKAKFVLHVMVQMEIHK
jgi:hypothetical protein